MELHPAAGVDAPLSASDVDAPGICVRYLECLPLKAPDFRRLLLRLAESSGWRHGNAHEAMSELHGLLAGVPVDATNPAYSSITRRLTLAYSELEGPSSGPSSLPMFTDVLGRERLVTAPPLARTSMFARPWARGLFARLFSREPDEHAETAKASTPDVDDVVTRDATPEHKRKRRVASARRIALLGLVIAQTYLAANFMTAVLPYHGTQPLEILMLILFTILFAWISLGFWTAMAGFLLLLGGGDRYAISRTASPDAPIDPEARVAIVMPICNENVPRVFAGLKASYESLARTDALGHFDFFVLSDTSDPDIRVAEIEGWVGMCRAVGGFGRVYYRWRQHRIKRKSGNIADFCRRWGRNYRHMVVLDADSVMSGKCLTTLLRLIEANPDAGIIQTAPRATGRETLYARVQQFATRVYGPLFTAGLHFWQLGESHYWGHNAIIRIAPFIRHCALGRLPGRGTLSGEILSHDFVEAALMRRAGWTVSIAYDVGGSYEEMPPNLIDELKRDRRWCQGNLMNFRLFLMKGLHVAHRAVFMSGVMAYLSAPLWFLFLLLSTALLAVQTLSDPTYFVEPYQLFPLWPEWHPQWAIALFSATAALLFLPKILAGVFILARGARRYGGALHLIISMLGEFALSALLAPIRMLFHTRFVIVAFAGWAIHWKSPTREDAETTWAEALRRHGLHTALGVVWTVLVYWLNPSFLWWLLPIVGALMLSIPISVYTSRVSLGRAMRRAHLFLIPEESNPPPEIRSMLDDIRIAVAPPRFIEAVVDPAINALTCAAGVTRSTVPSAALDHWETTIQTAVREGPGALSPAERMRFLGDPVALSQLHMQVWTSANANRVWQAAIRDTPRARLRETYSA